MCITSWIWLVCLDCLNWLCDAWAVSFVYTVSWICLGRLGCVCCPDCYFCWIILIGFLGVLIVLIIWTVSAVSFFGLLEMFFTFLYKYDLVFAGSILIVFWFFFLVCWGSFFGMLGSQGCLGGHFGMLFGSQGALWTPFCHDVDVQNGPCNLHENLAIMKREARSR